MRPLRRVALAPARIMGASPVGASQDPAWGAWSLAVGAAATLAWAALALPAAASTTPVLGLAPGERTLALALPAAAFDVGVRPGVALGVAAGWYYYTSQLGARATWTIATPRPGLQTGVLFGVGGGATTFDRASGYGYLTGQAIAQWAWGPMVWRGSLGPGFTVRPRPVAATAWGTGPQLGTAWDLGLEPFATLELAVPLGAHELTLGGNALLGWRGRF